MYFPRRTEPLDLVAERLLGLRLSLNSPVVQTQELPVGPARAAIVVHEEGDGRPNVTIAVRALRSGEVVLYSFEDDLREDSSLPVGVDAALSFGESMGFLFDDDEIEGRPPNARAAAYARILGWIEGRPAPAAAPPAPADAPEADDGGRGEGDELLLEEAVEPEAPARPVPPGPAVPEAPAPAAAPAGEAPRRLSKFRTRRPAPAAPAAEPAPAAPPSPRRSTRRPAALGRVRLVKRRPDGTAVPDERQSLLFRLLALF